MAGIISMAHKLREGVWGVVTRWRWRCIYQGNSTSVEQLEILIEILDLLRLGQTPALHLSHPASQAHSETIHPLKIRLNMGIYGVKLFEICIVFGNEYS